MSEFWEGFGILGYHPLGWNNASHSDISGLEFVSIGVAPGPTFREREDAIRWGRGVTKEDLRFMHNVPAGDIQLFGHPDALAMIIMGAFQAYTFTGTKLGGSIAVGTLTFAPSDWAPAYGGSSWGTVVGNFGTADDLFPLYLRKVYRPVGTDNSHDFLYGVVDTMQIEAVPGEEVTITAGLKFATSIMATQSSVPSLASRPVLEYYLATVTGSLGNQVINQEVLRYAFIVENNSGDRLYLGTRGPARFPWERRRNIRAELEYVIYDVADLETIQQNVTAKSNFEVVTSGFRLKVEMPNAAVVTSEAPLESGGPFVHRVTMRGYYSGTSPEAIVRLYGTFNVFPC